ncbi:hypothetical protein BOTBODRAFT_40010 [Botryobasidium botryosum FD-172 SS1]|uniref:Cystinosin n=1 Tax=Botryobasidium botryosum (strain FD-172 SS1) TaxID=930990 RepID=A0A067M1U5_BOTB1|nr:hypothetical protein BOTBODRAFT_40010 [Botryobasidium botryosum FD-172 SS1]
MVPSTLEILSQVIGWGYFFSWSISFYPQAILNWRRKSVEGLSIDYATLNALGHLSYAIYNANFYFNKHIRGTYRHRNEGNESSVHINDVAFAAHASLVSAFVLAQTLWYPRAPDQRLSSAISHALVAAAAALSTHLIFVFSGHAPFIDLLYSLAVFKLLASTVKYAPQALLNYKRKSTTGWSTAAFLLDFSGGFLSLIQLLLDAYIQHDWTCVTGNPAKFGLSALTILCNVIFIVQHFVLYKSNDPLDGRWARRSGSDIERSAGGRAEGERAPLLRRPTKEVVEDGR